MDAVEVLDTLLHELIHAVDDCEHKHGKAFIPCRCLMLTEDNKCSIYEDRPQNCRDIPNDQCNQAQPPECRFYED